MENRFPCSVSPYLASNGSYGLFFVGTSSVGSNAHSISDCIMSRRLGACLGMFMMGFSMMSTKMFSFLSATPWGLLRSSGLCLSSSTATSSY